MSSPRQMFAGSPLKKALEKSTEMIEKHGEKQVQTLKSLESLSKESPSIKTFISEKMIHPEIMNELENIRKQKQKIDKKSFAGDSKLYLILESLKLCQALEMLLGIT